MHLEERRLLEALISGDKNAFEEIFEREWETCLRIAYVFVWPDQGTAKDIVQDSFLKLWENRSILNLRKGYSSWLHTCVKNRSIDYLRKKRPINDDQIQNVQKTLEEEDWKEEIEASLQSLPVKQRSVVLLKFWQGLSIKEIAEILEIPTGTVGTRLSVAMQRLKLILQKHLC